MEDLRVRSQGQNAKEACFVLAELKLPPFTITSVLQSQLVYKGTCSHARGFFTQCFNGWESSGFLLIDSVSQGCDSCRIMIKATSLHFEFSVYSFWIETIALNASKLTTCCVWACFRGCTSKTFIFIMKCISKIHQCTKTCTGNYKQAPSLNFLSLRTAQLCRDICFPYRSSYVFITSVTHVQQDNSKLSDQKDHIRQTYTVVLLHSNYDLYLAICSLILKVDHCSSTATSLHPLDFGAVSCVNATVVVITCCCCYCINKLPSLVMPSGES